MRSVETKQPARTTSDPDDELTSGSEDESEYESEDDSATASDAEEAPLVATIRSASEQEFPRLYRAWSDDPQYADALTARRGGLDTIAKAGLIQSRKLLIELLNYWSKQRQPDVLAALLARGRALAIGRSAAPGEVDRNRLVDAIARLPEPTNLGEDGCEQRAHEICLLIIELAPEIAHGHLTKIWTRPKSSREPLHAVHQWRWHVAPCVRFASGEAVVFDCVLFARSDGAGPLDDWLTAQNLSDSDGLHREMPWELLSAPDHPDQRDLDEPRTYSNRLQ